MIIISWNMRGLNARIKKTSLRKLINRHDPQFIFIQETKIETIESSLIKSVWNTNNIEWLFSPSIGNSGGILSMWKSDYFTLISHKLEKHWIALYGMFPSINFHGTVVNIYNPCCRISRGQVWASITSYRSSMNSPCLVLGGLQWSPGSKG